MSVILDTSGGVRLTVASGLDQVFDSGYEMDKQPGEVRADDALFFRQDDTQLLFVQYAQSMGPGDFNITAEDEEVDEATVRVGNKTVAEVFEFDRDIPIPQRYQEASQHWGTVDSWVEQLGVRARTSRDKFSMRYTYGDAFSGVTTPDAVALISNSHVSLSGQTVDNLETGAASADNTAILIRSLRLQPAQDGDLASYHADGLLGPTKLHPTLTVITGSALKPGVTDNDLNYVSVVYPGLQVGASEFLDSTYNTLNSNADTSFFCVSRMHKITRAQRIGITREFVEPKYDRKRRAFYRARFSERAYAGDWGGVVGTNGTA